MITAKRPHTPLYDPGLLDKVPPATRVHRVFNPDVPYVLRDRIWKSITGTTDTAESGGTKVRSGLASRAKAIVKLGIQHLFNPDIQKFWIPFVLSTARRVIDKEGIDTVILNTPPFSLHAIIPKLKSEFPKLKWITEVRDDWLGYYLKYFDSARTDAKYQLAASMEGAGMRASDYVVAVTPAQRDMIRNRYPDQPEGKFLYIPNGYDADLYENFRPSRNGRNNMVVAYYGTLYATPPYDITSYLDALDSLPSEIRDKIETHFIGRIAVEAEPILRGRKSKLLKLGFCPQAEGVRKLQEADYMLLAANDPTQHAGKLFDYMATGLPILALSPADGEVARLLRETGAGVAVNGSDPRAIQQLLLDAFRRLYGESNPFPKPDFNAISAYERKNLVGRLVQMTGICNS